MVDKNLEEKIETPGDSVDVVSESSKGKTKKTDGKKAARLSKKKKKIRRKLTKGRVYVHSSYNNTIVSITDTKGEVVAWSSSGAVGFKGAKKATPYAASIVVSDIMEKIKDSGLEQVDVIVTGVGGGKESAIRALGSHKIQVLSIKDVTPIPHNGCRPPKVRRV